MGMKDGWMCKVKYPWMMVTSHFLLSSHLFRAFKKMVFERNKKIDELQQIETVLQSHIPQLVKKDAVHITRATAVRKKKKQF